MVTKAPGPGGKVRFELLSPPVATDPPPGGMNPAALLPFAAAGCVAKVAVPPPGVVTAESLIVVPAELTGVATTMFTDFELSPLIVPNEHVTGPVPTHPADEETKVVPAGKVSTTWTPATGV